MKITSGTTGKPRAVRTRECHLLADCRNICSTMGIGPHDINYGVIPFSHSYGFSNLITPLLYQGTRLVCSRDRLPRPVYEQILASEATVFPGTPALFSALSSLKETTGLGKVRLCISAGAPLQPEISRNFKERFNRKIHSFYGSSECGGITFDRDEELRFEISGYVGTPMDGVELKKIDSDRIAVQGDNVADGYYPDPDTHVLDGHRFIPGDLVEWIPEGCRLIGRASDVVNVAGKKVHPVFIEEHLRKHTDIMDAIVFGVPSAIRNEDLVAYVVGRANLSLKDVEIHCRHGLSDWQVPREIRIVNELPVNNRGKISRAALAQQHLIKGVSQFESCQRQMKRG
ncbi:MAG: acyl--CoA ligase [Verrucomicrobia bacterium]|nr:acyl--CoA ligase [Verrucomicrobiota bacterium]